jgi:hypothetical protein
MPLEIAMSMPLTELEANAVAASVTESHKTWNPAVVAGALRAVVNGLFDPYRPELHYMRGARTALAREPRDGASPDRG